jgi:hypothetical protein
MTARLALVFAILMALTFSAHASMANAVVNVSGA